MSTNPPATASAPAAKWFDSLPTPKSQPKQLSVNELHDLQSGSGAKVLVADVRRTDIEGDLSCMLPGAVNLPAQTFYQTLPAITPMLSQYSHVVFHCSSSNGRGPRCAAWYEDALVERGQSSNSYVLTGGIKAWVDKYPEQVVRI